MKKVNLMLFMVICFLTINSFVFAKNEVSVLKVEPYFNEESGVIGNYKDDIFEVKFNELGQEVSYKILLKNNTNEDLPVVSLSVPLTKYQFVDYEFEGLAVNDLLKANEEKEVILTLKTLENQGFARNFTEDLVLALEFSTDKNPNTLDIILYVAGIGIIATLILVYLRKYKFTKSVFSLVLALGLFTVVRASTLIVIEIPGIVSYRSLNILKPSGVTYEEGLLEVEQECTYPKYSANTCYIALEDNSHTVSYENVVDFWEYAEDIQNIYIKNEILEIDDYVFKYDVTYNDEDRVFAYLVENNNGYLDLYLMANGIIYANENSTGLFAGMYNLKKIDNIEGIDFSESKRLGALFYDDYSLRKLDLSSFNTSSAIDMSNMFAYTEELDSLDVSSFDTSKVNDMYGMFMGTSLYELDLSSFDTSNVVTTAYMFANSWSLEELNLNNINTQSVLDMSFMFYGLVSLEELDVSSFNTSNVKRMNGMFAGDSEFEEFTSYSLIGLDSFDTTSLESMYGMFAYNGLNRLDLSNFETPNLENMQFAFANMPNLECILLTNFDYSNVKYMASFLYNAYASQGLLVDMRSFDFNTFDGEFGLYSIYQNDYSIGLHIKDYDNYSYIIRENYYSDIEYFAAGNYGDCCEWPPV